MQDNSFWLDGGEYMVAADHADASRAGAAILAQGGNAVDAAVATSLALAVVRPQSAGLGGGGFMLIDRPGDEPVALDFRETAPASADRAAYLDAAGRPIPGRTVHGAWAVATPSQAAGLVFALQHYGSGRVGLREVVRPAQELARRPLVVDRHLRRAMNELAQDAAAKPHYLAEYAELYRRFTHAGRPRDVGESVDRSDLLPVLEAIAQRGAAAMIDGPAADAVFEEVSRRGGPLTRDDVAGYQVRALPPLRSRFGEYEVLTMPPPSSGGAVIAQVLNVIQAWGAARRATARGAAGGDAHSPSDWRAAPADSCGDAAQAELLPDAAADAHLLIEALKHAFADRAALLGERCEEVLADVQRMISVERAARIAAQIDVRATRPASSYGMYAARDDGGTSHYCVVDRTGMAVSGTDTVNLTFGAYVHVRGTGIILNNEIDDFVIDPQTPNAFGLRESPRNLLRPGARPLSSMSPTIVRRDGRVELIAGASGGPRIITATLAVILNVLRHGASLDRAVAMPRLHHQWSPDEVWLQRGMPADVIVGLLDRGHLLRWYPSTAGHAQAIGRIPGGWRGVCDPDKQGRPAGA